MVNLELNTASTHRVIILMGVSGCGKTSVGRALASALNGKFEDGDDYHPQKNVEKMREGTPLSDQDRWPWLDTLANLIQERLETGPTTILACSALARIYRDRLKLNHEHIHLVYLKGDMQLIASRLAKRENHYMPASLLQSQFDRLEEPGSDENSITVSINQTLDEIIQDICQGIVRSA